MTEPGKTITGITFGPFFLDVASRVLLRDGRRVSISPIELKLLETLLRHRDRVLTGDELRVLVWSDDPSAGITPAQDVNALYVAIRKLRRSLGQYGSWIVNIPKVGYTISEDVDVQANDEKSSSAGDEEYPFVGRQNELRKLEQLLGKTRLVTVTGPPGIGKSRLALKLADAVAKEFEDGVFSINLVPVENDKLVPAAVLGALGLTDRPDKTELEVMSDHLKEKHALLVLDNCEHVLEACSQLVDHLLRAASKIRIIATSREPFQISGESVMSVPPLSVPEADAASGSNGSQRYDAVDLFTTLAKRHRAEIEFDSKDLALIGELCRRLDGIPLAIELAAVQVGVFTLDQIVEVMSDRLRLLRRRGGAHVRHQTLEGAVDWSYSLLTEEERTFFRRLSIFSGGWTRETARAICTGDGVNENDVTYLLADLVRRSLVQLSAGSTRQRYSMFETIRQFGRKCLRESGEDERIIERHDQYFLELVENAFEAGGMVDSLARTDIEYDNVRASLRRSINNGNNIERGLRMCGALAKFWFNHGHFSEAKLWTKLALEVDTGGSPDARARALRTAGFFFGQMAGRDQDSELGKKYFEQSLAIWRDLGDRKEEGFTLSHYAFLLNRLGLVDEARSAAQQSLNICTAANDQANIARSANNLALFMLENGEVERAKDVFEVALSAARHTDDKYLEALCLQHLGETAMHTGELQIADECLVESLDLFNSLRNRPQAARTMLLQGEVAAVKNLATQALELERAALREFHEIEDDQGIASALEAIACTHLRLSVNPGVFLTLVSAADELRRNTKIQLGPARKKTLDLASELATTSLGEAVARSAVESGKKMSLREAVEMAVLPHAY